MCLSKNIRFAVKKIAALLVLFAILVLLVLFFVYSIKQVNNIAQNQYGLLYDINNQKSNSLDLLMSQQLLQTGILASDPVLINNVNNYLSTNQKSYYNNIKNQIANFGQFVNITVTKSNGSIIYSLNNIADTIINCNEFLQAKSSITTTNNSIYLHAGKNKLVTSFFSPLINNNGQVIAMLIITVDIANFLFDTNNYICNLCIYNLVVHSNAGNYYVINNSGFKHYSANNFFKHFPELDNYFKRNIANCISKSINNSKTILNVFKNNNTGLMFVSGTNYGILLHNSLYINKIKILILIILFISITILLTVFITLRIKKINIVKYKLNKNYYTKNQWFKTTLYSITDGVITTDVNNVILQMNQVAEQLTGYTEPEAIGQNIDNVFKIINNKKNKNNSSTNNSINYTLLESKTGASYPVSLSKSPILYNNTDFIGTIYIFRDRTDDCKKQELIDQSRQRLERSELASKSGSWEYSLKTDILNGSAGVLKIFALQNQNHSFDEITQLCLPEYKPLIKQALEYLIETNKPYEFDLKIIIPGTTSVKDIYITALYDPDKHIVYGTVRDITSITQLQNAKQQLAQIIDQSINEVYVFDAQTLKFEYVNQAVVSNLGYTVSELNNMTPLDIKPDFNYDKLNSYFNKLIQGNDNKVVFNTIHKRKNNTVYPVQVLLQLQVINNRKLFFAVVNDITSQVNAQKESELQTQQFKVLIDTTSDGFVRIDPNGQILEINETICHMFKYPPKELYGLSFFNLLVYNNIDEINNNIENIKKHGFAIYETSCRTKNNKIIDTELSISYWAGQNQLLIFIRDITDKKNADRNILNANIEGEERERNRFSQELHDGLGPLLSGIKLYFQWIAETNNPDKKKLLVDKGNQNINEAVQTLREISNNLSPRTLNAFGLNVAVTNFINNLNHGKAPIIVFNSDINCRFKINIELALYRVITELINNSIKHAAASQINVNISYVVSKKTIELNYNDNGCGFNVENSKTHNAGKGHGVMNINNRVQGLKGTISIKSSAGNGVNYSIIIPANSLS